MTAVIAIASDMHVNSTIGLYPPNSFLDDGAGIQQSVSQKWLWEHVWLPYWKEVELIKEKTLASSVYFVCLGDLGDKNIHSPVQLFTMNDAIIVNAMVEALRPSFGIVSEYIFIRGTEAHEGRGCYLLEIAAHMLSNMGKTVLANQETNALSHWFLEISFEGVNCVFSHHPGTNSMRPWTQGGGATRKAAWLTYDYYGCEWQPHLGVFGHTHHNEDSADNHPVRVIFARPMSFFTAYDYRLGHISRGAKVGGIIAVVKESKLWIKKVYHPLPIANPVTR